MDVVFIVISTIFLYAITINGYLRDNQIKTYDKSYIESQRDYNTGRRNTHVIRRTILTPIKRTYKFYTISKSKNIGDNQETSDINFKLSHDGIVNALKPKKKHDYHVKITSRGNDVGNYLNEAPAAVSGEKYTVETTKHGIGSANEISTKDGNNLINSNETKQKIDIISTGKSSDVSKNGIESSNLNQINLSIPSAYETQSEVHVPKTSGIVNEAKILKIHKNLHDNKLLNQDYATSVTLSTNVRLNNDNIGEIRNKEEKQSIYRDIVENGDENKNIKKPYSTEQSQGKKFNDKNDAIQNKSFVLNSNVRIENRENSSSEKKHLEENQIKPKLKYMEQKENVKLIFKDIIHRNLTEKSFDNNKTLTSDSNSKIKHKTNLRQEVEEVGTFNENLNITILSNDTTDQGVIQQSFRNSAVERNYPAKYTNNKEPDGPADIKHLLNSQKYFNEIEPTDNKLPPNEKKLFDVVKESFTGFVPNNHAREYNENYYYIQPQNKFHGLQSSYNYYDSQPKNENIGWRLVPNKFRLRVQNKNIPRHRTAAKNHIFEQFGDQNVKKALLLKLSAEEDKEAKNLAECLRNHEIDIKRSFNALCNDQNKILINLEELTPFCVNENLRPWFQRFVPKALRNFYK
ncbi:hypothetical protein K1T71_013792 [Dendrolimus kikuchii]|uniref:Uncharacterized protein n=1 Tax=Dendrolimus kikuchii TaxID=765133 RepID=A0ACC1CG06_9NEOP|nr:hypothetical protein K1T71_013792 [Dendrolimus kikuchii]